MTTLYRNVVTKSLINLFIDFIKENISTNKLYQNIKVTDRFSYESAGIPCVIIRQTTNTQRRTDYWDFIDDYYGKVALIPVSGNNTIIGNNTQRVNLPIQIDWNPTWAWDTSIPLPSGTDISETLFTSGTTYNTTDITTGIIIQLPPPTEFIPISIENAVEVERRDSFSGILEPSVLTDKVYNLAIGITGEQFYLIYSGTGMNSLATLPIAPEQNLVDAPGISGVSIKFNDVLYAGDQYVLKTFAESQFIAEIFGGIYDSIISFDIYALSTLEVQELCDLVERFLVENKATIKQLYGLSLTSWSKGGESEEVHLNEYIFKASLTSQGFVEWHKLEYGPVITDVTVVASGVATVDSMPIGNYLI